MKKIIIIDGNSLLFRAYYATSITGNIMHTKDGYPTNAIYAFSNMIRSITSSLKVGEDYIFVSFDTDKKTFRHQKMEEYKAQRKPVDEALKKQFLPSREFLDCLNIFHYELEGYEGDDLAGTVAKMASSQGFDVEIYTSDKDYLQLIDDNIHVNMIKKGLKEIVRYDEKKLFEDYSLTPPQVRDFKGLAGDPSDNIKGVPGIGDKTAIKLINQYGDLENIIESMKNETSKVAEKIYSHQDDARFAKEMATIITSCPIPFTLDDLIFKSPNFDKLASFYSKYEFFSLLKKIQVEIKNDSSLEPPIDVTYIDSLTDIKHIPSVFYLISDDVNYHKGKITKVVFSYKQQLYIFPIGSINDLLSLKTYFEEETILKSTFDVKRAICLLNKYSIRLKGVDLDFMLGTYLLDSSFGEDKKIVCSFYKETIVRLNNKEEEDYLLTLNIEKHYQDCYKLLKERNALDLYNNLELPLCKTLAKMEIEGFPLSRDVLKEINDDFKSKLLEIEDLIYSFAGYKFNISSPKQVGDLLFNKLNLPKNKKDSTSIEVLNSLVSYHPIVKLIILHRKYSKLVSTYTDNLQNYLFEDNKIHTIFHQALTSTGRLSSSDPNLQNISIKDDEGKLIRKAFFYDDDDYLLMSLDYSQIELRLLAIMANCQSLIEVFSHDGDIHSSTARKVFHIPEGMEVDPSMRRKAKAVNFGIVYGISSFGLAEQIDSSQGEAKNIIQSFYKAYPEIENYYKNLLSKAYEDLYVETMFGRRRYLKDLASDKHMVKEQAKRMAMNAPIQGTAADIIKSAMIKVDEALSKNNYKSKLVLQIHDELILKIYKDEKDEVYSLVKDIMENILDSKIKLSVEGGVAKSWYETK